MEGWEGVGGHGGGVCGGCAGWGGAAVLMIQVVDGEEEGKR